MCSPGTASSSATTSCPYAPLLTALRPLVREGDPAFQALAPQLRCRPRRDSPRRSGAEPLASGEAEQSSVFEALLALLRRARPRSEPVLLVIEDLHWADSSTRWFVRFLARTICSERMLVVGTYRSDELHRRHPLRPLLAELGARPVHPPDRADRASRARRWASSSRESSPTRRAPGLVERVYARSEGNAAVHRGDPRGGPRRARRAAAHAARRADAARGAAVDSTRRRCCSWLACQPRGRPRCSWPPWPGSSPASCATRCARPWRARSSSTVADDSYGFRHALLREVVYDDLLPGERDRDARGAGAGARGAGSTRGERRRPHHRRGGAPLGVARATSRRRSRRRARGGWPPSA